MLIVDDEEWVRERLIRTLDWESKQIEIVDEAGSGEEALAKAKAKRPDIILTDIRMPHMDGLELVRRLKEEGERAKTIIISGYSDFDYAKKAIALGAHDYILKPVEDEELFAAVERCLERIRSEQAQMELLNEAERQVRQRLPLLKQMFFSNLILDLVPGEQDLASAFSDFGIVNRDLHHACLTAGVGPPGISGAEPEPGDFVPLVMRNAARDLVRSVSVNDILFTHAGELVAIVSSALAPEELAGKLTELAGDVRRVIGRILGQPVAVGIGSACSDLAQIHRSYRQAKQSLLANRYLMRENASEGDAGPLSCSADLKAAANRSDGTDPLVNAIVTGDRAAAMAELNRFIERHPRIGAADLKFVYIRIVNAIVKNALTGSKAVEAFSSYCLHLLELLHQCRTVEEIYGMMADAIGKMIDFLAKTQSKRKRKAIEKAVAYLEEHYREPVGLNAVSDRLMLNPSYFSKIFREEMGIPFSKYLMELRISKAIELMEATNMKIYEIAARVGYEDVQYFTKMFKALKGVTPMQYREKMRF